MSDRTSKTILEQDKKLQERRKQEGLEVTPFNYDTNADKDIAVSRSLNISPKKIQENIKTLLQHALEANAPKMVEQSKDDEKITAGDFEAAIIDTSAIPSQEKTNTKELGDEDEKEGNER